MTENPKVPGRPDGKATAGPRNNPEQLSFHALIGELGDVPPLSSPEKDELVPFISEKRPIHMDSDELLQGLPEESEWFGTVSGDMPARPARRKREENPLNARVLTESGARKTPLWVK